MSEIKVKNLYNGETCIGHVDNEGYVHFVDTGSILIGDLRGILRKAIQWVKDSGCNNT